MSQNKMCSCKRRHGCLLGKRCSRIDNKIHVETNHKIAPSIDKGPNLKDFKESDHRFIINFETPF